MILLSMLVDLTRVVEWIPIDSIVKNFSSLPFNFAMLNATNYFDQMFTLQVGFIQTIAKIMILGY